MRLIFGLNWREDAGGNDFEVSVVAPIVRPLSPAMLFRSGRGRAPNSQTNSVAFLGAYSGSSRCAHRASLEPIAGGRLSVSPVRYPVGMTALCAQRTAGPDVKL